VAGILRVFVSRIYVMVGMTATITGMNTNAVSLLTTLLLLSHCCSIHGTNYKTTLSVCHFFHGHNNRTLEVASTEQLCLVSLRLCPRVRLSVDLMTNGLIITYGDAIV